jgi:hypothetical protein
MQSKPIALFFADSHLDENAWPSRPDLKGDSMWAFKQIVDAALNHDVKCVVGAGDLIDVRNPKSSVVEFIRTQLRVLHFADINFRFIQGQHELAKPTWFSAASPFALSIHERLDEIGSINVYGIDWTPGDQIGAKLAKIPKDVDVLVMHQIWDEFMGDIRPGECTFDQVPPINTLFTGDYHSNKTGKFKGFKFISPGATHMRAIDEPVSHYYYLLSEDMEWTRHTLLSRSTYRTRITKESSFRKFLNNWPQRLEQLLDEAHSLPTDLLKPVVRVSYKRGIDKAKYRLQKCIGDDAFLFTKELVPRKSKDEEGEESQAISNSVLSRGLSGCLPLVMDKEHEDFLSIQRLLLSNNVNSELVLMKKERKL